MPLKAGSQEGILRGNPINNAQSRVELIVLGLF